MNNIATANWHEANQRHLMVQLASVRAALERHAAEDKNSITVDPEKIFSPDEEAFINAPPAIDQLSAAFGLSQFERDVLLLCAGLDLDSRFPALCAGGHGDATKNFPTFGLALAALPQAHWSAITPASPLRYWRLIDVVGNGALTSSQLRIDERVLHYLAGVQHVDERLAGLVTPVAATTALAQSQQAVAEKIISIWSTSQSSQLPVVNLHGDERTAARAIAAAACSAAGLELHALHVHDIPANASERVALVRLLEREAALGRRALLIDGADVADRALESFLESARIPIIISSRDSLRVFSQRSIVPLEIKKPLAEEQHALWKNILGARGEDLNGELLSLVTQFDLDDASIRAAGNSLAEKNSIDAQKELTTSSLWDACRAQARPRLEQLAQRIAPAATWDDFILPNAQLQTLREIAVHVRHRAKVYSQWGFGNRGARGLGISALFSGPSGTGKTMAAEVLANELHLDLFRIDLSQVVSKYIGETEKNLRKVFDAAETGGAILLFDEADALFGKRSEVKDSHDRYANIEVGYLLQRMEAYRGLAILTTNLKNSLDAAFLRRIRFVVQFPFPDATQRAEIWRRVFPRETPTEGLDVARLARLNVAGGNIRNIALSAAFLAASANEPVRMSHMIHAARSEYMKMEKPMTEIS